MAAPELRRRTGGTPFPSDATGALRRELDDLWSVLALIVDGEREVLHREPARPTLGMQVVADGTDWDPGSGDGTYAYEGSSTASAAWAKL